MVAASWYTRFMFPAFLDDPSDDVARKLLGCELIRTFTNGQSARVKIVETESYDQYDAASHSYRGKTPRTDVMFGPSGLLYVYFTYGMHYCCNIVTGPDGVGSAVLLRAVEPLEGEKYMAVLRHADGVNLSNGPAKLCQALAIDKQFNRHDLRQPPIELVERPAISREQIVQTTRIGVSKDTHEPKRWYIRGNLYVSRLAAEEDSNAAN